MRMSCCMAARAPPTWAKGPYLLKDWHHAPAGIAPGPPPGALATAFECIMREAIASVLLHAVGWGISS